MINMCPNEILYGEAWRIVLSRKRDGYSCHKACNAVYSFMMYERTE
jgi:hypothetical protein